MSKFIIHHCGPLRGSITISGAKNATLPIMAACLLTSEPCVLKGVPPLRDVYLLADILRKLGAEVSFLEEKEELRICAKKLTSHEADYDLTGKLRASFLVMGPLLARLGKANVPLPGGCAIGSRPVDLHLKGFAAMGAKLKQTHGVVEAKGKHLVGTHIYLDFPSVGATENIMMAAALAEGTTVLENAASEPEICDLGAFLNKMGCKIKGLGTDTLTIEGTTQCKGVRHKVIPDRIEAGTYMTAAAVTHGDIYLENVVADHLKPITAKLAEAGILCEETEHGLHVDATGKFTPVSVKTMPYPGFPTDLQAPFMSFLTTIPGSSTVTETVFENRFLHVGELSRMGADVKLNDRTAMIEGGKKLTGTSVKAADLRGGAALVLCALAAEGDTEISEIEHIERGYYHMEKKLRALGAEIARED